MHGQRAWDSHKKDLDFLTLYFPGPDNVAHHVGAMTGNPTGPGPAGFPVGALGDTTNPLPAIAEQVRRETDLALARPVVRILDDGYMNACLFVLVADHGLIAYRNTDPFNLMSADAGGLEMQVLFGTNVARGELDLKLWRNEGTGFHGNLAQHRAVFSPNGGFVHIYLQGPGPSWQAPPHHTNISATASLIYREAVGHAGFGTPQLHSELAPRTNAPTTRGALGNPPAIFVRCAGDDCSGHGDFLGSFRWVSSVDLNPPFSITLSPVSDFFAARSAAGSPVDWPAFEARLEESNHRHAMGSRTGDIILIMNAEEGYLACNQEEAFNGWHGGPTVAESQVPLMFGMPGPALLEPDGRQFLREGFDEAVGDILPPDGSLRSHQLADILTRILSKVR
jgi:hypothetical protein